VTALLNGYPSTERPSGRLGKASIRRLSKHRRDLAPQPRSEAVSAVSRGVSGILRASRIAQDRQSRVSEGTGAGRIPVVRQRATKSPRHDHRGGCRDGAWEVVRL